AMGAAGCAVLSAAFLLPAPDIWTRLISAIGLLGVLGLATLGPQRAAILQPRHNDIALGAAAALLIYAAAWVLSLYGAVAAQARLCYTWRAGYSGALVAATVAVAAISEELFWRATVLRLLLGQLPMIAAVLAGTAMYALAHVASGTWLLPLAAL